MTKYAPSLRALQLKCCSGCAGLVFFHADSWFCVVPGLLLMLVPTIQYFLLFGSDSSVRTEFEFLSFAIFIAVGSLFWLVLLDPGYLPPVDVKPPTPHGNASTDVTAMTRWCPFCNCSRPRLSSHCTVCRMCIEGMDHHCYITGTCVGKRNHRMFAVFITSAFVCATWCSKLLIQYLSTATLSWLDVLLALACGIISFPAMTGLLKLLWDCLTSSFLGTTLIQYKKMKLRQKRLELELRARRTGAMPPPPSPEDDSYLDYIDFSISCGKCAGFWKRRVQPSVLERFLYEQKKQQHSMA